MQKILIKFIGPLIILGFVITSIGCADMIDALSKKPEKKPGWYGIQSMWNYGKTDVDGQVGYQIYVQSPTGSCLPSHSWQGDATIISGSLPSGLTMDPKTCKITGIPTESGHWIVRLKITNIKCGGHSYEDSGEQELDFHITGSGKVSQ